MPTEHIHTEQKFVVDQLQTPFEHIALAFSGGGFRAASFGLGVLSFLNEIQLEEGLPTTLLQKVTYLSSASGGTIATSMYALHSVQGKPFGTYYKTLFEHLEGTRLMEEALSMLNDNKVWKKRSDKTRNIINSFALAYDKCLYQHATVAELKAHPENTHLDEVCFNATELYHGLLFRQAVKLKPETAPGGDPDFLYGNFIMQLQHETADKLLLSDLLAASSCFPAGFEPMVYPNDFVSAPTTKQELIDGMKILPQELGWSELDVLYQRTDVERIYRSMPQPFDPEAFAKRLQEELPLNKNLQVCLMDGGITDNQGLESMMQANDRRVKEKTNFKPFDLMLVCDVGSHYMDAYQLPKLGGKSLFTINRIRLLTLILVLLSAYGMYVSWHCTHNWWIDNLLKPASAIIGFGSLVILIGLQTVKWLVQGRVRKSSALNLDKNFSPEIVRLLFKHFGSLNLSTLMFMLKERLTSVLSLNNDVFLKRIRYLLYDQFFNQNGLKRTGRAKGNHIYDLTFTNDENREQNYCPQYAPNTALQVVAETAFEMATTLWFSKADERAHQQAAVIACGQFTTCFNLLDYIAKLHLSYDGRPPVYNGLDPHYKLLLDNLQQRLEGWYEQFKTEPFFLYNKLGKEFGLGDKFRPVYASEMIFPVGFEGLRNR